MLLDISYRNTFSVRGTEGFLNLDRAFSIPNNLKAKINVQTKEKNMMFIVNLKIIF